MYSRWYVLGLLCVCVPKVACWGALSTERGVCTAELCVDQGEERGEVKLWEHAGRRIVAFLRSWGWTTSMFMCAALHAYLRWKSSAYKGWVEACLFFLVLGSLREVTEFVIHNDSAVAWILYGVVFLLAKSVWG